MSISNIDDLLVGGKTATQPATPEYQPEPEPIEELETEEETKVSSNENDSDDYGNETQESHEKPSDEAESDENSAEESHEDEYGNQKEVLTKSMQKRLDRQRESLRRQHDAEIAQLRAQLAEQGASKQVQQAAKDFEYDPNAEGDWQQQLQRLIEHTVTNMSTRQQEQQRAYEEQQIQKDFEDRLTNGMQRFDDFRDVIGELPCQITNPMTLATRSLADPAGFLYAAAKRHPQELERISKLKDPYAQMTEMGRLEERMRKNKASTQAPRPLGRAKDDARVPEPAKKKEETIEDLIARSDAKKLQRLNSRIPRR